MSLLEYMDRNPIGTCIILITAMWSLVRIVRIVFGVDQVVEIGPPDEGLDEDLDEDLDD